MAICLECGNSIGNTSRCSRCGGSRLSGIDPLVSGTPSEEETPDSSFDVAAWEAALAAVPETPPELPTAQAPSKESMREVRREARRRRRGWRWPWEKR